MGVECSGLGEQGGGRWAGERHPEVRSPKEQKVTCKNVAEAPKKATISNLAFWGPKGKLL